MTCEALGVKGFRIQNERVTLTKPAGLIKLCHENAFHLYVLQHVFLMCDSIQRCISQMKCVICFHSVWKNFIHAQLCSEGFIFFLLSIKSILNDSIVCTMFSNVFFQIYRESYSI